MQRCGDCLQTVGVLQVCLDAAALQGRGELRTGDCLLAPSGVTAAVAWVNESQMGGVQPAFAGPDAWQVALGQHGSAVGHNAFAGKAFSPSASKLVSLHKKGTMFEQRGITAQTYDVATRSWSPELIIHDDAENRVMVFCGRASWSPCETLAAAVYLDLSPPGPTDADYFLAVWGATQDSVRVVPLPDRSRAFAWLPDSSTGPTLVVRSACALARFEFAAGLLPPGRVVQPQWIQQASDQWLPMSDIRLAVLPSGQAFVTLHCCSTEGRKAVLELALFDSVSLCRRSFKWFRVTVHSSVRACDLPLAVHACQRAAAACVNQVATLVYAIGKGTVLGTLLFKIKGLVCPSFSVTGQFLCGLVGDEVWVVDTHTSLSLAQLQPAQYWFPEDTTCHTINSVRVQPHSVVWAGAQHRQLHITARATRTGGQQCVSFTTLTFQSGSLGGNC